MINRIQILFESDKFQLYWLKTYSVSIILALIGLLFFPGMQIWMAVLFLGPIIICTLPILIWMAYFIFFIWK